MTEGWRKERINIQELPHILIFKMFSIGRAMVAHAFNPSTWEAEAGRFLSSRPAWSTERVPGQPWLDRETEGGEGERSTLWQDPGKGICSFRCSLLPNIHPGKEMTVVGAGVITWYP